MKKLTIFIFMMITMLVVTALADYPTVTIRQIQEVTIGEDSSYYEGDTVHVGGIVVGGTGLYYAGDGVSFYMEMAEGGIWSGIMAYNADAEGFPTLIPGDSISVDAEVHEYGYSPTYEEPWTSNMTELDIIPESFTFHSFSNPEPAPLVITADIIDTTGGAGVVDSLGEQYEGVYVRVYNVTVDSVIAYSSTSTWICSDTTGHQFMVREASDSIAYLPTVGTFFNHVSGVIYHRFDNYNIQPRYLRDISFPSGGPIIGNIEYSPEYPFSNDPVVISATIFDADTTVASAKVKWRLNLSGWISNNMTAGEDDYYSYTMPALPAGSRIDFYIVAWDANGDSTLAPSEAPYNFYTYNVLTPASKTIAQAKVDANNDFIPDLMDSAVILTGIATSYNYDTELTDFFMQDGEAGINVYFYDSMVNIEIGDSIVATGIIDQYYGKTQLMVYDVDRIQNIESGHAFDTLTVTCAEVGEIVGEAYEGRLVKIDNVTITDPENWPSLGYSATLTISDVTGSLSMRIDESTNIPGQNVPEGTLNIVGCLGQYTYTEPYDDSYQITPRLYADFTEGDVSVDDPVALPRETSLAQNYPNPFNPSTSIYFYLAQTSDIDMSIYDLLGRKVYSVNQTGVEAGEHQIVWDGVDYAGQSVATGVYFYRLKAGSFTDTKQMTLIK